MTVPTTQVPPWLADVHRREERKRREAEERTRMAEARAAGKRISHQQRLGRRPKRSNR